MSMSGPGRVSITYDYLHDEETIVTDAETGGKKGSKLTQVGALDPVAIVALARVAGYGADVKGYGAFNFLQGYDWALSYNAMQRHANLFWAGEDTDVESGQPHMAMAAWHAMTLVSFALRGLGTDSRPPRVMPAYSPTIAATIAAAAKGEMTRSEALRAVGSSEDVEARVLATLERDLLTPYRRDLGVSWEMPICTCPLAPGSQFRGVHLLECPAWGET